MKTIPLSQGKVAIVDDADYEWLNQWKWSVCEGYARRSKIVNGKRKTIWMHKLILPKKEGMVSDHINGNSLDNRRLNLRHCTRAQNNANRAVRHDSATKLKGVWKNGTGFSARITANGNTYYLGIFKTPVEAGNAYALASVKYHAEFSRNQYA